jgi:hypothetical protein
MMLTGEVVHEVVLSRDLRFSVRHSTVADDEDCQLPELPSRFSPT